MGYPPSKSDVKVSFHPAQVVSLNKDIEWSSYFRLFIYYNPPKKRKNLLFTQVSN